MSEHIATLVWKRESEDFSYDSYNRNHLVDFGHENVAKFSAAPQFAGSGNQIDPEQAFTASAASCHMLTFLAIASKKRFIVNSYEDEAIGTMGKNEEGKYAMLTITLRPKIAFGGDKKPSKQELEEMHKKAHENCIISNSITTRIEIQAIAL